MSETRIDDSEYDDAIRRAQRVARFAWKTIGGVSGLPAVVAVVAAVALVAAGVAPVYAMSVVAD